MIQKPNYYQRYMLCLQDPADPFNDVGKKSFAIKDVQTTLQFLHADMSARLEGETLRKDQPKRLEPMLRRLVGRCDQIYDEARTKLELFGEDLSKPESERLQEKVVVRHVSI